MDERMIQKYYLQGFWTKDMVLKATEYPKGNPILTMEQALKIIEEQK